MNIAFFMRPKQDVTFVYSNYTVRQVLEKMHQSKYTAIPVLEHDGTYVGTVSEGDLLWFIVKGEGGEPHTMAIENLEDFILTDVFPPFSARWRQTSFRSSMTVTSSSAS